MSPEDAEAAVLALANRRNRVAAEWFVELVLLAVETHPEEMKRAFHALYDHRLLERLNRKMHAATLLHEEQAREIASSVRALAEQVHRDIDGIEKRIDSLLYRLEQTAKLQPETA
jgi:hypothetical protein